VFTNLGAVTADALSYGVVAALTAASGVWVLVDMPGERTRDVRVAQEPDPAAASDARARATPARD
jgi:hypothetical protein